MLHNKLSRILAKVLITPRVPISAHTHDHIQWFAHQTNVQIVDTSSEGQRPQGRSYGELECEKEEPFVV